MSCMGPRTRSPDHLCPAVRSGCYALHRPLRSAKRNYNFTAICLGTLDLNQSWPGARLDVTSEADGHFTRICIALAHVLGSDATSVMERPCVDNGRGLPPSEKRRSSACCIASAVSSPSLSAMSLLTPCANSHSSKSERKTRVLDPSHAGYPVRQNAPIAALAASSPRSWRGAS